MIRLASISTVCLALCAAVGPRTSAAQDASPAAWIPANFDVYLELTDAGAHRKQLLASKFFTRLSKTRFFIDIAADPGVKQLRALQDGWSLAFGRSFEDSFDDVLGMRSAIALRFTGAGEPEGLIVGRGASEAALKALLEKLIALRKLEGSPPAEIAHGQARIVRFAGDQYIGLHKDVFAAAEKEALVKAALDLAAGKPGESLAGRPEFKDAFSDLPDGSAARFFLDVKQAIAKTPPTAADPAAQRTLKILASIRSAAIALYPGEGAVKVEFALRADVGGFHPLLSALLGPEPAAPTIAKLCPADAFLVAGVSLDTAGFRKALEEAVPELTHDEGYQIFIETFYKQYIEKLGPEFALIARRGEFGAAAPGLRVPAVALAAKLKDSGVARSITDNARSFVAITKFKARKDGLEITVDEKPHNGVPIFSVNLDAPLKKGPRTAHLSGAIRPTMAQVGDFLVVGLHDSVVRAMIDAHAGGANLTSDPTFKKAMAGLAEKNSGWAYVSVGRLADVLAENRAALIAGGGDAPEAGQGGRHFDGAIEILRLLESAGMVRTNHGDRARQTIRLKFAE